MHLGFEIKPNGFLRKTGGYLGSRDGGGGDWAAATWAEAGLGPRL